MVVRCQELLRVLKEKEKALRISTEGNLNDETDAEEPLSNIKVRLRIPKQSMHVKQMRMAKRKMIDRQDESIKSS